MKKTGNKYNSLKNFTFRQLWSGYCRLSQTVLKLKGTRVRQTKVVIATMTVLLGLGGNAWAQTSQTISQSSVSNIGFNATATASSNLEKQDSANYSATSDFSLTTILKNLPFGSLNLFVSGSKGLTGEREFNLNDGAISNTQNLGAYSNVNFGLSMSAILPLSENSQKNTYLNTKLTVTPIASYQFKNMSSALDWLSISYRPNAGTYFHDYKVTQAGGSNPQYSLGQRLIVSISLSDSLSLDLDGGYTRYYSYQGSTWDIFNFDQSLSYAFNAYGSIYVGHNNAGNALAPNGRNSNIDMFDNRSSTVYSGLNIAIP